MTPERIKRVLREYLELVVDEAIPPKQLDKELYSTSIVPLESKLRHIGWMCQEAQKLVDKGELEKAGRWLGFIQGWLWAYGYRTIDEMRDDNRS